MAGSPHNARMHIKDYQRAELETENNGVKLLLTIGQKKKRKRNEDCLLFVLFPAMKPAPVHQVATDVSTTSSHAVMKNK